MKTVHLQKIITLITLSSILFGCSTTTIKAAKLDQQESKYNHLSKINHRLNKRLYKLQIEQKDFKDSSKNHKWAEFIRNINYLKNDQIEIYVNDKFKKLNMTSREHILTHVKTFSFETISKFHDFNETDYTEGLNILIYHYNEILGRSEFLNNKELVWYD